ncbi:YbaY family lipoprotein [Pseudomonas kuykendallii]|uniref:Lipoprotein n=1 Tax=Pseudomonas kuykendallii TaxID=1007099 RepID=A0A2W5F5H6_9PSED|nr:YbaY family lipoprotein [Pseudomonas kuykendallii]PZP24869.1 MAG: hypothetical protein DI599_06495 [Pseudomonas kuykendallii]
MPLRPLCLLFLAALLAACASAPDSSAPPAQKAPAKPVVTELSLPDYMRELVGTLNTPPAGSEVELALLVIDERDRPQQLLGSLKLAGTGGALPFRLPFNPAAFPADARVELRARVVESGVLTLRLPPKRITRAETQTLGALGLEVAP